MEARSTAHDDQPEAGYLRLRQVLDLIPVSPSTWWAGVKSGRYPRAVKIGPNTTAWKRADISRLMTELESAA